LIGITDSQCATVGNFRAEAALGWPSFFLTDAEEKVLRALSATANGNAEGEARYRELSQNLGRVPKTLLDSVPGAVEERTNLVCGGDGFGWDSVSHVLQPFVKRCAA